MVTCYLKIIGGKYCCPSRRSIKKLITKKKKSNLISLIRKYPNRLIMMGAPVWVCWKYFNIPYTSIESLGNTTIKVSANGNLYYLTLIVIYIPRQLNRRETTSIQMSINRKVLLEDTQLGENPVSLDANRLKTGKRRRKTPVS